MTAELTTVVGQFSVVNGIWKTNATNQVAVREPKTAGAIGAGKGDLFVLVEVRGAAEDRESLERQLVEMFRDAYYMARGSITASLRRAMQVVGSMLYDRNYAVGVEERIIGGLVAVATRGEDAFVAQIGPAACFTVLGGYVQRYPARSVWLDEAFDPESDEAESALGISILVEPRLHHLRIGPDDVLVLADSGLASQLPLDDVLSAVNGSDVKTAIKNLGSVAQSLDCSAMVLAVVKRGQPAQRSARLNPTRLWPPQKRPSPRIPALTPESAHPDSPAVPRSRKGIGWLNPFAGRGKEHFRPPSRSSKPLPQDRTASRTMEETMVELDDEPIRERAGQREKVLASTAASAPFQTQLYRSRHPGKPGTIFMLTGRFIGSLGRAILLILALLGRGLQTLLSPLVARNDHYGYRQAGMKANRTRTSAIPWKLLRNIAIAIPLLVAIIVGVSYLQKGRLQEAEYRQLVETAQTKVQQAAAVDRSTAMALMTEAKALLTQAEQIKPGQPEITQMRQQIAAYTDKLANVIRLGDLTPLRQYTDPGTDLRNIEVQGMDVYVLDAGNDRIYHHQLDDLGQTLLPDDELVLVVARGQTVDDVTVGDLIGMTWMPVGGNRQTSDLVILGSHGLMEYHPTWGIAMSALASPDKLLSPVAVSSYFGNFYVLDPAGNQLLRYLPTADGYSALPESYFPPDQPVDLTNAVDFAIDGAIYVLFRDGRIAKYLRGEPTDFNLIGLDRPFNNPTDIFTAPGEEVQYVYVADTGNRRIVQMNKDGSFVRQLKPGPDTGVSFANLQDIFVDELGGRIFILAGNTLYMGNLPPLETIKNDAQTP